jgi:hypothetical protein
MLSKLTKRVIFLIQVTTCSLVINTPVFADMFSTSHSCSKPYKPYQFQDGYELEKFKNEVQSYKNCIEAFVKKQNDEAEQHYNAAKQAINEWNSYANYDLR